MRLIDVNFLAPSFLQFCCFRHLLIWFTFLPVFSAADALDIAVIETRTSFDANNARANIFKEELVALFEGERQINFIPYKVQPNTNFDQVSKILNDAYSNPQTDVVLVLDIASNQVLGRHQVFEKPTFLPLVFSGHLLGYPIKGKASGKKNLNYLTSEVNFEAELVDLNKVVFFKNALLLADENIARSVDQNMIQAIIQQAKSSDVNLQIRPVSKDIESFISQIPNDVDAVLYGFFPSKTKAEVESLIQSVNERGIPSFSLSGEDYVRLGALATNTPDADWKKLARRMAIHVEEVLLGKLASDLPIFFEEENRLTINMATAQKIRVAPNFDVLNNAKLLNQDALATQKTYSLNDIAQLALESNLTIIAQRFAAERAKEAVRERRSALLPQLGASVSYTSRRDTSMTRAGLIAEESFDGFLSFSQSLYSDQRWAAYRIEKYAALTQQEVVKELELDIVQVAVNTYLNVLLENTSLEQARFNLTITQENFRLAQNRVKVGAANASDLYRWESELANAKQAVLLSESSVLQQRQILNQLIDRPINESFSTTIESIDNPSLLISDPRITNLIQNSLELQALAEFLVELGLQRSPELKQIRNNLLATQRQLTSSRRAYWLPDIDLSGQYSGNFDEERAAGGFEAEDDWIIAIEASLPIYDGGLRKSRVNSNKYSLDQFKAELRDVKNRIEQDIRNTLASTNASYNSIPLAKTSEVAAEKNYELVVDSYVQGTRDIVDVLDAQQALINAREVSKNSVYAFLIDLMNVQRAAGAFDFFLSESERGQFSNELIKRVYSSNRQSGEGIK